MVASVLAANIACLTVIVRSTPGMKITSEYGCRWASTVRLSYMETREKLMTNTDYSKYKFHSHVRTHTGVFIFSRYGKFLGGKMGAAYDDTTLRG